MGVDVEVAQQQLAETLATIKKYQHFVFFYAVVTLMEFFAWPPLTSRIDDPGANAPDVENLSGFAKFYASWDYITMLSIWWWITAGVSILIIVGIFSGDQGSGKLVSFHRLTQYIFLAMNAFFLVGSGFGIPPFGDFIEKG